MKAIDNPVIPTAYVNFAKACAALAKSHGIKQFRLFLAPDWEQPTPPDVILLGEVQINYSSRDSRGRDEENLSVYLTTNTKLEVKEV